MEGSIRSWLFDILHALDEIDAFFVDRPKNFEIYHKDIRTKRAVERNLEIIGEAIHRILQRNNSIVLPNARKIVDTRNRIIHGYDTVSDELIWGIVLKHLPILRVEVEALLKAS